jgi:hypothetical protein
LSLPFSALSKEKFVKISYNSSSPEGTLTWTTRILSRRVPLRSVSRLRYQKELLDTRQDNRKPGFYWINNWLRENWRCIWQLTTNDKANNNRQRQTDSGLTKSSSSLSSVKLNFSSSSSVPNHQAKEFI